MVYKWKQGARFKADAAKVKKELDRIGDKLTPEQVVKAARKKKSELHKCFEWNDKVASQLYRLEQARRIIRSIVEVQEEDHNNVEIPHVIVRAYENVTTENGKAYVPTEKAMQRKDWREEVFEQINAGIYELEKKARAYQSAFPKLAETRKHLKNAKQSAKMAFDEVA